MAAVRYLGSRLGLAVVTLFLISVVTFLATNVVPSDPARRALGKAATEEQLAIYREQQGLDRPVLTRYGEWLGNFVQGDWGDSAISRTAVQPQVVPRMERSLILAGAAMLLAVPLAYLLGVFSGLRAGRRSDVAISLGALFVNSLPEFVVGLVLLVLLAVEGGILPIESSAASLGSGWDRVEAYVLPVLTLAIVLTPYILRMVRANVRETAEQPFVRAAVLRGLPHRRVVWQHVVPNASLPVVNVVALSLAELVGGVVVTESVFGFPGVGKFLVDSVGGGDIPVVQAIALIMGIGFVVMNLVADGAVLALNPRLRGRVA